MPNNPADDIVFREQVAQNVRHWLRVSRVCNNRCLFCHDSNLQDGVFLQFDALKKDIHAARAAGAERLILSGGEASIHPRFADLVAEGKAAGYEWVQTISNGRMFSYADFTRRAVEAGLREVTISIHGPNAAISDKLTGIKGSFEQSIKGMLNLIKAGCLVTVDVVINTENYRHLSEMIRTFYGLGIREFDLLYITPFGRAYDKNPELLFKLENGRHPPDVAAAIKDAIETSRSLGCTVWTNRVPPELLEGCEMYVQDPHKLTDEVRGRSDLFEEMIDGLDMRCREAARCELCFVYDLCTLLKRDVDSVAAGRIESAVARVSDMNDDVLQVLEKTAASGGPKCRLTLEIESAGEIPKAVRLAGILRAEGPDVVIASRHGEEFAAEAASAFPQSVIFAATAAALKAVIKAGARPGVILDSNTAKLLKADARLRTALKKAGARLAVPTYELLSEEDGHGVDITSAGKVARSISAVAEGLPGCLGGTPVDHKSMRLDVLRVSKGKPRIDLNAFAEDYIARRMMTKSLRCASCSKDAACPGFHINHARLFGYRVLKPTM